MKQYYCHNCAAILGLPSSAQTGKLLETHYQLEKFIKHTTPPTGIEKCSIFSDPSTSSYANYIVNTSGSGWVQVDDEGRCNMTWYAGKIAGAEYRNSRFYLPAKGIRVVFFNNEYKIHAFPDAEITINPINCLRCGVPIPYEP